MIPQMASMTSSSSASSATVRVDKATSEFLIGPDWTLNIEICDIVNSNQTLAKDVVKAVKKRLQHRSPKVQLLALTLLETMVKNCGDYVHFQIAERSILPEMVKIVKKKTDMHVRDKILTLIGTWREAFGGPGGRYPQYHMAYEDLRRLGIRFPQISPDSVKIVTPPVTHPTPRTPQPVYGMPSGSSTRLDEAMAAEESLSLSSLNGMRNILDLLADMLQAVDPTDRVAVKDEVIIDLVEQCRTNQRKLVQLLATTVDEELLGQGLELNDNLQGVLAKHNAIASGSPLPQEVKHIMNRASDEKHDDTKKSSESSMANSISNGTPSVSTFPGVSTFPAHKNVMDEEDEEEDDFAQLARRHAKAHGDVSSNISEGKTDSGHPESPLSDAMNNALVPVSAPTSAPSKDQDIIDLLSLTLSSSVSTQQTSDVPTSPMHAPGQVPSTSSGVTFASETYPGLAFNNYVAPWAQPQPQPQPQSSYNPELAPQPQYLPATQSQPLQSRVQPEMQPQHQPQYHNAAAQAYPQPQFPQYTSSSYPPPPWAATPGYLSYQNSALRPVYTSTRPSSLPNHQMSINGEVRTSSSPRSAAANAGQKPFIPSYRLFEDLDVFGNADKRFNGVSKQNMVGGRK